jgi:hypothetical protein
MDPYFYLPPQMKKSAAWKRLVRWSSSSVLGGVLSKTYDWLKDIQLSLRGSRPPANANFSLLQRWSEIASKGLPVLLFKAPGRKSPGTKPRVGEFDYIQHILALSGRKNEVRVQLIEATDHSFANRAGRSAVRDHTESWLSQYFPLSNSGDSPKLEDLSVVESNKLECENHAQCL